MKQVLEAGVEWGYLGQNPIRARSVKAPKQVEADIRPFRSWEEVDAVASHAGGRYESLIKFACATGLRPEEWIALTWADVSLLEPTATINKVCVDGVVNHDEGKTEASFRTIHLQQRAVDALLALPQLHTPHDLIFTSPTGQHINLDNWRRRTWKPAVEASGLTPPPAVPMQAHLRLPGPRSRSRHLLGQPPTRTHRHPNHRQALRTIRTRRARPQPPSSRRLRGPPGINRVRFAS